MILYVNGDSHSAGCEAVHPAGFLTDNSKYRPEYTHPFWKEEIPWSPYPDNLEVSYGKLLADKLNATLHCHARSAGSNDRIIRTTLEYLKEFKPELVVIGWSTWEREEWYNDEDNQWYQVNGSGIDSVPVKWKDRYKNFVINVDWIKKTTEAHEKLWLFHLELQKLQVKHLFFNACQNFYHYKLWNNITYNWGDNYVLPYENFSYIQYLKDKNYKHSEFIHFGPDGHAEWAEFLFPYLTKLL